MKITFLGTAASIPTKKRNLSAIALEYLGELFLFDCGEGTLRQMMISDINFMNINHIFITHMHADHILGIGGLIQSMDFLERKKVLNIHGGFGIKEVMNKILSTGNFILDSFELKVHELNPEETVMALDEKKYAVKCFKTLHSKGSLGYVFEEKEKRKFLKEKALKLGIPEGPLYSKLQDGETIKTGGKTITPEDVLEKPQKGRKIVYTGDTIPCREIIEASKDCDLLIHDSTYSEADKELIKDHGHSTAEEAAKTAKKANAKKLYLTHISQRYANKEPLEKEAQSIFKNSYIAEDFTTIKIEKKW